MPSGKTHDTISIIFLPILLATLYFIGLEILPLILITVSYLFSSFMFNGDLDLPSKPYYRWSILRFIWKPYQSTFSHRSIYTHGIIIGTIIRLIYLGFIPFMIMFLIDSDMSYLFNIKLFYIFLGLEIGAALHTISDYLF